MRNYTIRELAEMIVDSFLKEKMLNKDTLIPIMKAHIKTLVDLKQTPKDYNKIPKPNAHAARMRTIEKNDIEIHFWKDAVKDIVGEDAIRQYYKQLDAKLVAKGFKEPSPETY